jgi:AGZA family xanthine/uracil permease-like MFS transporter
MAATAAAGIALGLATAPRAVIAIPFRGDYSLAPIALHLDLLGVLRPHLLPVLLTLFLMGLLDTLGTLVALGSAASLADEQGNLPEIEKPMMVDAAACMFSGLVGTSTAGVYIESATGIRDGARTGLAAVTTGVLFLASLFFIPLVEPLQSLRFAYAPALVVVGLLMLASARHIDYDDMTELVPAFAAIELVVFTYNIANGLTAGLALHPIVKVAAGRAREVRAGAWVLAAMSFVYFVFGLPH